MSWTTPADVRAQLQRLWERGDLLRAVVSDDSSWPLRLSMRAPSAADLSDRFDAVRGSADIKWRTDELMKLLRAED